MGWKWIKENLAGPAGAALGYTLGGPAGGIVGGALGGAIGGSKDKKGNTTSTSGFADMPAALKEAYLNTYVPDVLSFYKNGPNGYQQAATNAMGSGLAGLAEEIPYYMQFYDDNLSNRVMRGMEEDAARQRTKIQSQFARNGGLGGLYGTALGQELALLDKNTANRMADYRHDVASAAFDSALGLRRQTLQDLMTAGDQQYNQISRLGSLLGLFPNSTTSRIPTQPTNWGNMLTGALMAYNGYNSGGLGGFGNGINIGNQMPWQQNLGDQMPWLY